MLRWVIWVSTALGFSWAGVQSSLYFSFVIKYLLSAFSAKSCNLPPGRQIQGGSCPQGADNLGGQLQECGERGNTALNGLSRVL